MQVQNIFRLFFEVFMYMYLKTIFKNTKKYVFW